MQGKAYSFGGYVAVNHMIVVEQLASLGVVIEEAENGQEALTMVSASAEGYYDIILMDIQMPVMNGYEASRALRAMGRKDAQEIPIIAMTANAFREDVEEAMQAGMTEHLAKPIEPEKLTDLLLKYIGSAL